MKTLTFSGMATCTVGWDFNVTVTAEDISEDSIDYSTPEYRRKYSVEDVEAWTDEQVRAYVEEHMLKNKVDAAFVDADEEYDDDMSFDVDEVIFEEVEG
jgi:hypothetical protein